MKHYLTIIFIALAFAVQGQTAKLVGVINNEIETPVRDVNIVVLGTNLRTVSNYRGEFELTVPADKKITIKISNVAYSTKKVTYKLSSNEVKEVNIKNEL